MTKQLLWTK